MMWCLFFTGPSSAFKTDMESVKMTNSAMYSSWEYAISIALRMPKASAVKIEVPSARVPASSIFQEGRTAA